MKQQRLTGSPWQLFFMGIAAAGIIVACSLPDIGGIHLSSCTKTCTENNTACLDDADTCFDDTEACFDNVDACTDACKDCETSGACADEDDCYRSCSDTGIDCIHMIDDCIDEKEVCMVNVQNCFSDCIKEAEDTLNGKSND